MNFSVCLLEVFLLVLLDICVAKVMVIYRVADGIEKVYAERKKDGRYLGHIASLTQEERLEACKFYRAGDYVDEEESKPHIYEVVIPDAVIPEEEKDEAGMPVAEPSKTTTKEKEPMDIDPEEQTVVEPKYKQRKLEKMKQELKEEDEEKTVPKMIYIQDIAFRCRTNNAAKKDFILSYGFAQEMFFVSEPVGELDAEQRFSGRKMKLTGYMFAPLITPWFGANQLAKKYFQLRKRTETVRGESPTVLDDIEKHDDISALTFQEKKILCASIMETQHYKNAGYLHIPTENPEDFEYVIYPVGVFDFETLENETFDTDFLPCKAGEKKSRTQTIIGVTRSYAEGGDVYTSVIQNNNKKQFLDVEVTKIAVLFNRKYAGEREGVLEVLEAIRAE